MLGRRAMRYVAIAAAMVAIIAGGVGLAWVEPWYERDLVEQMQCRGTCAIRSDQTARVAGILPVNLPFDDATRILYRNGFGCKDSRNHTGAAATVCSRRGSGLPCTPYYTITLVAADGTIKDVKAETFLACL